MKSPKQNPFSLILICMLLLMITQTLVSFGVVFWQSGSALLQEEITFAEADALMLDIMYEIPKDDNIGRVVITREYIQGTGGPIIDIRSNKLIGSMDQLKEIKADE